MKLSDIIAFIKGIDDTLGATWREWLPETLRDELRDHFGGTATDDDLERLLGILAVIKSDMIWYDEFIFEKAGHLICDNPIIFDSLQPLTPSEVIRAVHTLSALKEDMPFGHNVRGYIVGILIDKGITWVPDEWNLPEDINDWLEEVRPAEKLPQETLRSAYEKNKTYDFVEDHLSVVLARMIVVNEMIGKV